MYRIALLLLMPGLAIAGNGLWAEDDQPWIEIYGREHHEADINNVPVFINRVDQRTFNGQFEVRKLAAGTHEVIFQTTRIHRVKRKAFTRTLTIDAKPCTRYYVSAYHDSNTSPRYEVKIDREETIKPCMAKFEVES